MISRRDTQARPGMTLLEVLVVMSVIAMLASILLPSMAGARESARAIMCKSNLSQIVRANLYYADDNDSYFCPGATGMRSGNLQRWFGTRLTQHDPFDPRYGPITPYLGDTGAVRQCPDFPLDEIRKTSSGFEVGCGGYGYNQAFIGREILQRPSGEYEVLDDRAGAKTHEVKRPAETVMFADAAFAGAGLIEYSFIEPRFHPEYPLYRADPSIHFRHRGTASLGWVDGHVDAWKMTFTWKSGFYPADPERYDIGWFGTSDDNKYFDLD